MVLEDVVHDFEHLLVLDLECVLTTRDPTDDFDEVLFAFGKVGKVLRKLRDVPTASDFLREGDRDEVVHCLSVALPMLSLACLAQQRYREATTAEVGCREAVAHLTQSNSTRLHCNYRWV